MQFIYTGEDTWLFYEAQCVSCCKSVDYTSRHKHTDFLGIILAEKGTTSDPLTSTNLVITVREYHCLKQHYIKSIQKYLGNKNAQNLWHKLFQKYCLSIVMMVMTLNLDVAGTLSVNF